MLGLPKEIAGIMQAIEKDGYEIYIVGGSLRDMLLGFEPTDWDLASNAPLKRVKELFLDAGSEDDDGNIDSETGERYGVVRVKVGGRTADVAAFRIDGSYSDHRRPDTIITTNSIEEDLARRDFTINGMAYHPRKGLIDPYEGQKDLRARLIRTIGDPEKRFAEDPLRILRGLRFVGQLNFDLALETFSAIQRKACLLEQISLDRKRDEFEKLLTTGNAGKALGICASANILDSLFYGCHPPEKIVESDDLSILIQNIDRSQCDVDLRLALLLLCFEKQKAMKAIDRLNLSKERARRQRAAQNLLPDLHFAVDKYSLKRFIYLNGEEIYGFLTSLCIQRREVYGTSEHGIESRSHMLDEIRKNNDPVYIEDLAINGNDLIEAGVVQGGEVGRMLRMLLDTVHRFPDLNTKPELLKKAKSL